MSALADLFVRYRNVVGWMLLAVTLLASLGYLLPSNTRHPLERYEAPLEENPPTTTERVQSRFNLASSDAFLVVEADNVFTPETIAGVRRLVAAVEGVDFVQSVFWIDRVPILNVFGFADPLVPSADASAESFRQSEQRLRDHPLAGQLISDDGKSLLMPVVYNWLRLEDPSSATETVLATAREAAGDSITAVRLTGRAPLFADQQSAFDRNQIVFQAIGYTLALILSSIMFRGVAAVFVVAAAPCLGVFWTLGLVKLFGVPANPLAQVVMPVMLAMVGLTDGVHLLVQIRRRRAAGDEPVEAARDAITKVGLACWLTSLTTAIGFGSLLLAKSDYVQDFGRVCMIGVFIAFLAVVTFIPWVSCTWVGRYIDRGHERDVVGAGVNRLSALIDLTMRRRWLVSAVSIALTVGLCLLSLRLTPDNRMKTAMPESSQSYQALEYADAHFGGVEFFRAEVHWPETLPSDDPQILAAVRDVEALVADEPLLSRPLSIRSMLASFPGDPNDLTTQATFLSLMPSELRSFFYDMGQHRAIVSVRMQDRGIAVYTPVFDRIESAFAELEKSYPGFVFKLDGQPVLISRDLYQIVADLRSSLGAASAIILVVLSLVYRSLRIGLVAVVPNLFPLVLTAALLLWSGSPLDMSSVCAFVVCLGIAVDDTIHFLSRFQQELAVDGDIEAAIRRAFIGVGSALVMTTVILCAGFGTMLWSELPGHRTFAAMAVSTIAAAVIGDLIALPALLSCFHPHKRRRAAKADIARHATTATEQAESRPAPVVG
ncbi:bifunctional preprotein translocase subunit SecD/SecF [Botrimarina colliarenosi]|uniref:Bifunctional preprotein translocase subunit SecD/SecF n=1 Tax=Botrimarina colliarenosi TaxID=2528001 RepID=A0A5C6AJQ0_9BACT|nr:efflux RND transporter permease subunit [Botrimarina colliarenosi]TWT99251.1 bifunctional preprotein translocase subunit SecD/SecF [Botrimarina colliarenosi]